MCDDKITCINIVDGKIVKLKTSIVTSAIITLPPQIQVEWIIFLVRSVTFDLNPDTITRHHEIPSSVNGWCDERIFLIINQFVISGGECIFTRQSSQSMCLHNKKGEGRSRGRRHNYIDPQNTLVQRSCCTLLMRPSANMLSHTRQNTSNF